ncbi:hypothetical protein TTHERM_001202193 (macronuclear) [Tetrahymena thermophila SB210]|uniref:Uncharacterized protein n=1 Tax=Tetrahymena thermophila (strain SB210) TaxID=312017 RepID=W7X9S7_TETTS|nr:hypothetical protein TTHERM_001202193 [Tetrahymena thermophila SB210]EWS76170.1 hypothetical protein TTHERM_001202193 [Tetrahymena thermophila SB210]|eukprot:XP_012651294.1 hypothetical protein TTHERM_001202193 [Tetrahymena thermophila SB210]
MQFIITTSKFITNPPYQTQPILSREPITIPQYKIQIDTMTGIFFGFTGFEAILGQIVKYQQYKVRYQYLHKQIATQMVLIFQMIRELVLKIAQMLDTIMDKFQILYKETQTIACNVINLAKHVMVKPLKIVYLVKILITFSKSNVWLVLNNAQTVIRNCNVQVVPKNFHIIMITNVSNYNQLTLFVIKVKFVKIVTKTVKLVKEQLKKIVQVVPNNFHIIMRANVSSYNQLILFVIKVKFVKIVTKIVKLVKE